MTGRRTAELVRHYLELLGNPTGLDIRSRILSAAELTVLAEQARFNALEQTATIDAAVIDQVVRLETSAWRAIRRLGLDKPPKRDDGTPSLADYLSQRETETPRETETETPASRETKPVDETEIPEAAE
jgi:hypothetical protein